jgi:hypothetical protein
VVKAPLLVVLLDYILLLVLQLVRVSVLVLLLGFAFGRSRHLGLALGLVQHLVFVSRSAQQQVRVLVLKRLQGRLRGRVLR